MAQTDQYLTVSTVSMVRAMPLSDLESPTGASGAGIMATIRPYFTALAPAADHTWSFKPDSNRASHKHGGVSRDPLVVIFLNAGVDSDCTWII